MTTAAPITIKIPPEFIDLANGPPVAALTTVMPDGRPQTTAVWYDYAGQCVRVNTTAERRKGRNMRANPRVTLLIVDPDNTARYIEFRGMAQPSEAGAFEHLDTKAYKNRGVPCYATFHS